MEECLHSLPLLLIKQSLEHGSIDVLPRMEERFQPLSRQTTNSTSPLPHLMTVQPPHMEEGCAYEHRDTSGTSFTVQLMAGTHDTSESVSTTFSQSTTIQPDTTSVTKSVASLGSASDGAASDGVFFVSTFITGLFQSFTFKLSTTSVLNYPLFYVSQASLTLASVTVTSESTSAASVSASIVRLNGTSYYDTASVTITGCTFSLISYSEGNGACVNAVQGMVEGSISTSPILHVL